MTDVDIVVATFSQGRELVEGVLQGLIHDESVSDGEIRRDGMVRAKAEAVTKINVYWGFVEGFLHGFSSSQRMNATASCISMLDVDPDTLFFLQKKIAGFAGVTSGARVTQLQKFVDNLNASEAYRQTLGRHESITP